MDSCQHHGVRSEPDRLSEAIQRLQADGLMPPVRSVELAGGGIIRVTVVGAVEPEQRARLVTAMGPARWELLEAIDAQAAGADFGTGDQHHQP